MTENRSTPEVWRDTLEAILEYQPAAQLHFRYETIPHRAITRLFHEGAPDIAAQQALSAAVFQLLDETTPTPRNVARLFHLIRAVGAVKPAGGLNLLQKLLRENTLWNLKHDAVVLHTLALSMAGEYLIGPSFARWIRADCTEKADFDHALIGFSVLANQEISPMALSLLEQVVDLASVEPQANQLARELMGLSHPHAEIYYWIRELRTRNPDSFEKTRGILGDYFLSWTDRLEEYSEPYEVLLNAEIFAGRQPFSMRSIRTIAATQLQIGSDSVPTTLDLLYDAQKWKTNYDDMGFAGFLHIQGGPKDVEILYRSVDPKLVQLLAATAGIEIDRTSDEEVEAYVRANAASLVWQPQEIDMALQ